MKLSGQPAGELREFTPEACGNRTDPKPCRVVLRNPTEAQKREILAQMKFALRLGPDGKPLMGADGKPQVDIDMGADTARRRRAIEECLVAVHDLTRPGPNGTEIAVTETDFLTHAPTPLLDEVSDEALTGYSLSAEAKKKSEKLSVSSPPMTRPFPTTAAPAARKVSVRSEAATDQPRPATATSRG